MITIDFSQRNGMGLCDYIVKEIKSQVEERLLKKGARLPSKRALAEHLGVSVITVQNAYARLIDEGVIYSVEKKGFFVSDFDFPASAQKNKNIIVEEKILESSKNYYADFSSNAISMEKFPFTMWAHLMRQVLSNAEERLLKKSDVFGEPDLRKAIMHYLKEFRNMQVSWEQIVIGAGTESLYSMLVYLLGADSVYAVENPGYHKVSKIFTLNGIKCIPVNIDEEGLSVEDLKNTDASVVHVSPTHHFPTGTVMSYARRRELLDWAESEKNRFIIEDDYDSEFRFNGKPLPPLQTLDSGDRVIYMNTFSKTLAPSFRISYMVLPFSLLEKFKNTVGFFSCPVSSFEQFTLARFIGEGHYEKHINRMKNFYRGVRNNLISAIENSPLAKISKIKEENSGLHFLLTIKSLYSGHELKERMKNEGINVYLLEDFYYGEREENQHETTFVINYSALEKNKIAETVERMCRACAVLKS